MTLYVCILSPIQNLQNMHKSSVVVYDDDDGEDGDGDDQNE